MARLSLEEHLPSGVLSSVCSCLRIRIPHGSQGLVAAKIFLMASLLCSAVACVTTVQPPLDPPDPVTVVLVDYGHHTSLILPAPGDRCVEFAFGEWSYFALNQDDLCTGMMALCCPSQGTLGRRSLEAKADPSDLRGRVWCQDLMAFTVARANAETLRKTLEERFQKHSETSIENHQNGLTFVKDDESYLCWNNCNHVVAEWLRQLGCRVRGCACFANFRIEPPAVLDRP